MNRIVVAAVISRFGDPEGKVLLVRRGPGQSGAGFWEFPGGKVEVGESDEQALIREIDEELSLSVKILSFIGEVEHSYPSKKICLRVYLCEAPHGELVLSEHDAHKWILPAQILTEELSEADRPFVKKIMSLR